MSETKHSSEEHESVDPTADSDVVARANDALADANAAANEATGTAGQASERPAFAVGADGTTATAVPSADAEGSPVRPAAAPLSYDSADAGAAPASDVAESAGNASAGDASAATSAGEASAAREASEAAASEARDAEATDVRTATPEPEPEPEPTEAERRAAVVAAAAMNDDDDTPWYDRPEVAAAADSLPDVVRDADETPTPADPPTAPAAAVADEAPTTSLAPPSAPVATPPEPSVVLGAPGASTVFVQAPEEPRRRGNRGFSGVVALLATIIFAPVYLAALLVSKGTEVFASGEALGTAALAQVGGFELWTPVIAFFLGFWLLGSFLNTAKWGYWVIFGVFVGVIALAGHVLGGIFAGGGVFAYNLQQAYEFAKGSVFSLPGLVAFVIGRELPIWFGGWIARRGRKVIAANIASQEEYERTLEAGPQLAEQ